MKTKGNILALVSSGHGLPLQDGKVYAGAGYYLNELTRLDDHSIASASAPSLTSLCYRSD